MTRRGGSGLQHYFGRPPAGYRSKRPDYPMAWSDAEVASLMAAMDPGGPSQEFKFKTSVPQMDFRRLNQERP